MGFASLIQKTLVSVLERYGTQDRTLRVKRPDTDIKDTGAFLQDAR